MPAIQIRAPLPGSERIPRSGSRIIRPVNRQERIEITLHLRPLRKWPDWFGKLGALPPLQRLYLDRQEFASAYGAAADDVKRVTSFAAKNALELVSVDPARRTVALAGPAEAVCKAFQVKLMEFKHPNGNYRSHTGPVLIPQELVPIVRGVFGLDNRRMARPYIVPANNDVPPPPTAGFTAPEMAGLYNFPSGLDGSGQCIGILEFGGGYHVNDLEKYFKQLGIAMPAIVNVSVDRAGNVPGTDAVSDSEVALDIEVAGAIVPGARIAVYFAPFTDRGWTDALTTAVHDKFNKPSVISISWGFAEEEPANGFEWTSQTVQVINETLQAAAAMGITVCIASGDAGSSNQINDGHAHVNFPASSPGALGCGGTRVTAAGNKIQNEVVWNNGIGGASGGGISAMVPLPNWQKGIVPSSINSGHRAGRGVPDVCGHADPAAGYRLFYGGKTRTAGGTSAVAPLWAALLARINQKLGRPVGYFNPLLYGKISKADVFHDIVQGSNDTTGRIGGYSAAKGWDACTGWGSPNGARLLAAFGG